VVTIARSPVVREGLKVLLASAGLEVLGVYTPGPEAVAQVRALDADVVFLTAATAAADGFAILESIRRLSPRTAIILLSMREDVEGLLEAVQRGASCYLSRDLSPQSLLLAARAAVEGYVLVDQTALRRACAAVASCWVTHEDTPVELTARERQVLQLVSRGLSNGEIAAHLSVGAATVKTHVSNILSKLGVTGRVQAAVWATEHGLAAADAGQETAATYR